MNKYTNKDKALKLLLGGIGAGNISLDSNGRLCDFEVMGHPDMGLKIPYTFFSMWYKFDNEDSKSLILEAKPDEINNKALGYPSGELFGLPRFDKCSINVKFPFYHYNFKRKDCPLGVSMVAVTPFIPLCEDESGIPGFKVTYQITNDTDKDAKVSVCGTMNNFCGMDSYNGYDRLHQNGQPVNTIVNEDELKGISFDVKDIDKGTVEYGNISLAAVGDGITIKPYWQIGDWWDGAEEFWQEFSENGSLKQDSQSNAIGSEIKASDTKSYVGSVCNSQIIKAHESKKFEFYITWYFPNRYGWWPDGHAVEDTATMHKIFRKYYTNLWSDSLDVLMYMRKKENWLIGKSKLFSKALYQSTLSSNIIECLVSGITVIRSNTCFRLNDGKFYGWEGCFEHAGSCGGTCTHVFNYAQTLAFLFPKLEQDARNTEFLIEINKEGMIPFRAKKQLEGKRWDKLPAVDGQLGCVLRVFREWKLSGDNNFLKKIWKNVSLALEYAINEWDEDKDGILDKAQHNTYDIEFYGPNSLCNSIFYAALKAGALMAECMGENDKKDKWLSIWEKGSKKLSSISWNGEYFEQKLNDINKYKYQYGKGCFSDQIFGQELAHLYGLGYVLPEKLVKTAMKSVYKYNYLSSLECHSSVQRAYAFQDEGGLILCSWPEGGRPQQPFVYSDEVWTGMEYQVATNLIYEGFIQEALTVIDTSRKRFNGKRRNPYNENECGNHYVRSMASWGLLVALSGYKFDMCKNQISFDPKINKDNFKCFFSNAKEWGIFTQTIDKSGCKKQNVKVLFSISK